MKQKGISMDQAKAIHDKYGLTPLPKDHPIYSEGPTITFLSHTQKPLEQKAIASNKERQTPEVLPIVFEVWSNGKLSIQGEEIEAKAIEKCVSIDDDEDEEDDGDDDYFHMDSAYLYWRDTPLDRREFGIVLVEGDSPGSDYFAAELTESLEYANQVAARLGVPIRFE